MTKSKRALNDDKRVPQSQIERFKEAAREIGCDEDETRFDEKLGKLVKQKPKPAPKDKQKDEKTPD